MEQLDPHAWSAIFSGAIKASADPRHWRELCDLIAELHDSAAFMVYAYDLQEQAAPAFYGSRACWEEAAPFRRELETGENPGDTEAYPIVARSTPGELLTEAAFYGLPSGAAPPLNPWRDRLLAAIGAETRYAMKLNDVGPHLDVAVYHSWNAETAHYQYLSEGARFLHPLLTKTLETSRTFEALAQSYSLLLDLFDKLDFAVAFCDSTNRLLVANAHLRALATERIGLYIGNDVVEGETVEVSARIRACICAALQGESEPSRLCTTLPRKDGGSPLLLRAAPMRERQVSRDSSVALVVVLDPENESRISVDGLAAFNLLSPAELDVCRLLVRGIPTGEIAEHRSTGLETTRSQIKSAQAKLGCTSRLDLLRLALVTTAPFKDNGFPPSGG